MCVNLVLRTKFVLRFSDGGELDGGGFAAAWGDARFLGAARHDASSGALEETRQPQQQQHQQQQLQQQGVVAGEAAAQSESRCEPESVSAHQGATLHCAQQAFHSTGA